MPQKPQLATSLSTSVQVAPHSMRGAAQPGSDVAHTPAVQVCPVAQARPQPPQLAVSACVFTHALLQLVCPTGH